MLHPLRRLVEPFITGHSVQVVKLLPDQANRSEQLLTPKDIPSLRIVLFWPQIGKTFLSPKEIHSPGTNLLEKPDRTAALACGNRI